MGGIEAIDPRLGAIYDRAVAVFGADERVVRVDLGGSVGKGAADRWSDLDLEVIAVAEHHGAVVAEWPQWLAEITPTVFARTPIAPFIINTVTTDGLTLDIAVFAGQKPNFDTTPPGYAVGLLSGQRFTEVGDALEYAIAELLRGMAGPFVSLLQREEHLRHLTGVPHLLGLLTTVFLAETGAPAPSKHWNATYTPEQRAAVAALPPVSANRDDLLAFGIALAEEAVTRARPLYPRYGLEWPGHLAAVVADRVQSQLQIDTHAWLY